MAQTQHSCHQPQSRRLCCQRVGRVDGQAGVHVEVEDPVRIDVAVDQWCQGAEVFGRQAPDQDGSESTRWIISVLM